MPIIAGGDCEPVPPRGSGNVTVFNRHALSSLVEEPLLIGPHVRNRYVKPVDSTLQRIYKPRQPGLKNIALTSVLQSHPVGQLRCNNRARITALLVRFRQEITRAS